jgi:radical SAM superfamily enzyme YgiQ (UPF0313 family)
MKIIISYPPLNNEKGCPTLGQNRQFQYFKEPTYIYPVVPAQAATLLRDAGNKVIWNDCLAEGWDMPSFLDFIKKEKPDIILFESKTPIIKQHWKIIDAIKGLFPKGAGPKVVLCGDHVTALPEESFHKSQVDFVITGGDYDFLLLNLSKVISRMHSGIDDLHDNLASELAPGIWYRSHGHLKSSGDFQLNHDLDELPFIDRDLTKWQLYAYKNGNYKRVPGTYIMSGRDCWWGKCTFCSWPALYPKFRTRSVNSVLDEIGMLISRYNVAEIMDDTGCFPAGEWLRDFCRGMIKRKYNKKVYIDCNMRFGALSEQDFLLMKEANFRLLLFGLESANQQTLDKLNKNLRVERITVDCKAATKAGLFPHITIMFGYPWEEYEDARKTLQLGTWLLKKGYAYTMQATVVIPYPSAPLFMECQQKGLLTTFNWDDYDMKQSVMKLPFSHAQLMNLVKGMYRVSFQPEFIMRKAISLKDKDDVRYALRAGKKVMGHILDFSKKKSRVQGG